MINTFVKLWNMSKKRHADLIKALLLSLIQSGLAVTQMFAIITAIQVVLHEMDVKTGCIRVLIYMFICVAGNFIVSYFEQIHALTSGMFMCADLRQDLAKRLKKVPLGFFQKTTIENSVATLTTTLQGVETAATISIIMTVSGLFNALAMFIFMIWFEYRLALIMFAGIVVYLLIIQWQIKVSYKCAPARQKAQTQLSSAALIFSKGIRVIKSYCFPKGDEGLQDAIDLSMKENLALTNRSMPSQFAAQISIAVFESILVICTLSFKDFTLLKTILLLIFSYFAYASLNQAGSVLSMIGMIESGLHEVEEMQKAPVLLETECKASLMNDGVKVEDVHFSYDDREILHGISTEFKPNTLTALIGPSGSGKTTLCRMIARFQDVDAGKISIGGVDIKKIPYETLMEKISIVFQDVYLFEDTILNNIRFGKPDASLEEVRQVAKLARCDDFIMGLENGYDTMVQEGGNGLSGGEKQRISIARAMLKDAPIIIMDEATSALDAENESAFFEAVDRLIQDKTVIMIAHRISSIQHANQIVALKNGSVVQMGTPEELSRVSGLYSDFLQSRKIAKGWKI